MRETTVRDVLVKWLKDNKFDGLYSDHECGCEVDDLAPCGELCLDCHPGVKEACDCGDHDYHVGPKPKQEAQTPK